MAQGINIRRVLLNLGDHKRWVLSFQMKQQKSSPSLYLLNFCSIRAEIHCPVWHSHVPLQVRHSHVPLSLSLPWALFKLRLYSKSLTNSNKTETSNPLNYVLSLKVPNLVITNKFNTSVLIQVQLTVMFLFSQNQHGRYPSPWVLWSLKFLRF